MSLNNRYGIKFESQIRNAPDDGDILRLIKRAFADPKSNMKAPLKLQEAIELLKYLDKSHLINDLKRIEIPKFDLNALMIFSLEIMNEKTQQPMKLNDYLIENQLKIKTGQIVYDLRMLWIESNYELSTEDLLKKCDFKFLENYISAKKSKLKK